MNEKIEAIYNRHYEALTEQFGGWARNEIERLQTELQALTEKREKHNRECEATSGFKTNPALIDIIQFHTFQRSK